MFRYLLLLFIVLSSVKAEEDKIFWKKTRIPYNYVLKKDLKALKCASFDYLWEEMQSNNTKVDLNKLWAENFLILPFCLDTSLDREKELVTVPYTPNNPHPKAKLKETSWKKIKVEKGFILSNYLWNEECTQIWSYHIPLFRKKNSHVNNTNWIKIGTELEIQSCKEKPMVANIPRMQKKYITYPFYIYYGRFKKNLNDWKDHGGFFMDLSTSLLNYELNAQLMDRMIVTNHFSIDFWENDGTEIAGGVGLVNFIGKKNHIFSFLRFNHYLDTDKVFRVQVGSNFKDLTTYVKTQYSWRHLRVFYSYLEDDNVLNSEIKNIYHTLGIGYVF